MCFKEIKGRNVFFFYLVLWRNSRCPINIFAFAWTSGTETDISAAQALQLLYLGLQSLEGLAVESLDLLKNNELKLKEERVEDDRSLTFKLV